MGGNGQSQEEVKAIWLVKSLGLKIKVVWA